MQFQEIQDNIRSRRNKIFLLMEEVSFLKLINCTRIKLEGFTYYFLNVVLSNSFLISDSFSDTLAENTAKDKELKQ